MCVGVLVGVSVGVIVGVCVGVSVGVAVGVSVAVSVGVAVGVSVGVFVAVGVGMGPLMELTTSPAELPLRFHKAAIFSACPESRELDTEIGLPVELTVVADDHEE